MRIPRLALVGAVVLVFSTSLLVGLAKLIDQSRDSSSEIQELIYWSSSQMLLEYWRFLEAFDRYALGVPDIALDDVLLRLDIVWSRMNMFDGGAIARRLSAAGDDAAAVAALKADLEALEPAIRSIAPGDTEAFKVIRDRLGTHALPLFQLAKDTNIHEQARAIDFRLETANTYWALIVFLLGTIASGGVLIVMLIRETRNAAAALASARDAKKQAQRVAEHLTTVLDNAVTGIITIDTGGVVRSFNPAAETLFGHAAERVVGKNVSLLMPDSDSHAHDGHINRYVDGGEARVIGTGREVTARRGDGETFPAELSISEMWSDGERYFVGFITDLTDRKRAEGELRQAQKMDALGKLTGGVAHEFNNLLNAIGGFAQMALAKAGDAERVHQCLGNIVQASDQAAGLTRQMLAFARKQVLESKVVATDKIIGDVQTMIGPLVHGEIVLRMEIHREQTFVRVDPAQFSQGLLNLAINGCYAMAGGGELVIGSRIVVADDAFSARFPQARADHYVALFVSDTGGGIDDKVLGQIFEPFFTTKEQGEGTGLGLSMVHGMVEQSGGFIDVETEVGAGSTFTIYLPVVAGAARGDSADGAAAVEAVETGAILIAEPKAPIRELARLTLEEHGHVVLTAKDGFEAAEVFRTCARTVDVLLTDVAMPGKDGPALARELAAEAPDLKVIFMSGHSALVNLTSEDIGAECDFLPKPFDPDRLVQMVGELLGAKLGPAETGAPQPASRRMAS
jgi:PAS domain S-box-containing protein